MNVAFSIALAAGIAALTYGWVRRGQRAVTRRSAQAIDVSEARAQEAYDRAPDMMASVDAVTGRLFHCNQTLADALGCSKGWILGLPVFELYDPSCVAEARRGFKAFLESGAIHNAELVLRRRDGRRIDVSLNASAVRDTDGRIVRARFVWHDITEHKRAVTQLRESLRRQEELLRRETLLLRELNHRVRNNLAGILGLVRICERSGKNAREIAAAIRGKIRAMAEAHDMISTAGGEPIDLASLLGRLAADAPALDGHPIVPGRVRFSGPPVAIPAAQTPALAMIVQELLTNAHKHGALAAPEGVVVVTWSVAHAQPTATLELTWIESGGPAVGPPRTGGIGLSLVQGLAGAELRGGCAFYFDTCGIRFVMTASLAESGAHPGVPGVKPELLPDTAGRSPP